MLCSTNQVFAAWEGIYRYDMNSSGCHWSFHSPKEWKLAAKSGRNKKCSFADLAEKIRPLLPSLKAAFKKASHVVPISSSKPIFPKQFTLLDWANPPLATVAPSPPCCPAVVSQTALMLNHVVSSGTVRPFKILSTFVRGHLTCQIKGLPPNSPCWFYSKLDSELTLLDEYLLTFPELFFSLDANGYPARVLSAVDL